MREHLHDQPLTSLPRTYSASYALFSSFFYLVHIKRTYIYSPSFPDCKQCWKGNKKSCIKQCQPELQFCKSGGCDSCWNLHPEKNSCCNGCWWWRVAPGSAAVAGNNICGCYATSFVMLKTSKKHFHGIHKVSSTIQLLLHLISKSTFSNGASL